MSQFIIERKSQDSAMKYKMVVRINGGEKIELLPGEQKEIDLTDGSYEVVASLNLQKKALKIEMPKENKVVISYTNSVQIESPNRAEEYDLGATSAPIVEKMIEEPIVTSSEAISEASVDVGNKMYCSQCGGQIEANSKFCKHCGASVGESTVSYGDGLSRIEIICPHCKSNQVTKTKELQTAYYGLCFIGFGVLSIIFSSAFAHWFFGLLSLGSLVLTVIAFIANSKLKSRNVWILVCDTCGKNFEYPIPPADSKEIITNIKIQK